MVLRRNIINTALFALCFGCTTPNPSIRNDSRGGEPGQGGVTTMVDSGGADATDGGDDSSNLAGETAGGAQQTPDQPGGEVQGGVPAAGTPPDDDAQAGMSAGSSNADSAGSQRAAVGGMSTDTTDTGGTPVNNSSSGGVDMGGIPEPESNGGAAVGGMNTGDVAAGGRDAGGGDVAAGGRDAGGGDAGGTPEPEPVDIVETAIAAGNFTILAEALTKANLIDTLQGPGPFTVFAPTDDAFGAYLEETGLTTEQLLDAENVGEILTYHVVSGNTASTDLAAVQVVSTVAELSAVITSGDDGVKVNNRATVTTADVVASNGVIHIVDKVIPPADVVELASAHPAFST
ncbi:MAG: fasciclin domain-containing protein, partial [Myxococcota bacterium]|nr:fasciclin domain-containing protein [Myxococcota bacterium]